MLSIKNYFTKIKISIFEEGIYITIWNMIYKMICMYFTDDRMISNVVQEEPPYRVWWPYSAFSPPGSSFCKNNRYLVACTQSRVNLYIFNGFGTYLLLSSISIYSRCLLTFIAPPAYPYLLLLWYICNMTLLFKKRPYHLVSYHPQHSY